MKISPKIDQFYLVLALVMAGLSVLVIFTLRGIFGSINTAGEIEEQPVVDNSSSINGQLFDKAVKDAFQKEYIPLDLK